MRKLNNTEKNTVILLCLTVLAFFLLNLVIDPALKSRVLDDQIKLSARKLERYRSLVGKKALYRSVARSGHAVSANEALADIEKMAREAGVRIIEIRPESGQVTNELSIGLLTEAGEDSFVRFLYELDASNLVTRRVQLSAKPNSDQLEGAFSLTSAGN